MAEKNESVKEEEKESIPQLPKIPEEVKEKFKEIKEKLDKFQKKTVEKFEEYILGIALMPPKKEEGKKPDELSINILVLVDDSDSKKMSKYELKEKLSEIIVKFAEEVDKRINPEIMLASELRESCFDAKYEILRLIALSAPIYDPKEMLAAIKICEVHKELTIKKFEKYIMSYVAAGSLFRGEEKSNDIDVYIIVDDTDVKKMSRAELKDKLRVLIISMGHEAAAMTGVKKAFHIQVYILTDFWDFVKDASPVIFTFLRDGVPLYDRGVFTPWYLLLKMGRLKPSAEAIDMSMDLGEKLIERAKQKMLSIAAEDLYYATLNPSQAALMLYGLSPPTPKETIQLLTEIFVKKEGLLEQKYVDVLDEIRKVYKDIEHGKKKEITGKEVDELLDKADDYLKRIKRLFTQIEKKKEKETLLDVYDTCMSVTRDALKEVEVEQIETKDIIKVFKEKLIEGSQVPEKLLRILKDIDQAREDYETGKLTKSEIEKVKKDARLYIKTIIEYIQRKRGIELERARIRVRYGDQFGEIILLDEKAFIIHDIDAKEKEITEAAITKEGGLGSVKKSDLKTMEEHLTKSKIPKKTFIKEKIFEDLKKIFGKDIEILVNY